MISNVQVRASGPGGPCCTENLHYTYDADNHIIDWIGTGTRNNVQISWDYAEDGPCGTPPGNSSAVCLQVTTVEPQFEGSFPCANCPDYGVRAVQLCDLAIGSCPEAD